ncbi:prolipoprotein diacylglyceryl transferase family protein [Hymenobacter antarcticus]|uniref:Phosphatidylglycerol:prolipoprotein diacylglycerol transferase n=1 Tax=Hymenobacter antarcticus TaxID=486270 RepID=A0ABP7R0M9_9BACT
MTLPYAPDHDYYTSFYLLATFTNVLLLLVEGWRRGFPLRPWLTLVAAGSLALILGTKLITHPVGEWGSVLFSDAHTGSARSILGGGLAATLAVLALRRWLGLGWAVLDALALPLCGALVVQCVGCVLTGCCFGLPTTEAWGLTYAAGTLPWAAQVQAGLLPTTAAHSLPIVPTQLLALLLCAAVAGVLLAVRRRRWPVGSWLLLQGSLLLLGRFAQTFWRDPAGEPVAGTVHAGLGGHWLDLQLVLLPVGLLLLGAWAWRVRRSGPTTALAPAEPAVVAGPGRTLTVVLAMLVLTALLGRSALTLPEMLVVRALLLTVLVAEASAALATLHVGGPRLVGLPLSLVLAGAVLLTTAQAPAPQRPLADSTGPRRTTILTGGVLGNHHEVEQDILYSNSGCSGSQRLALQQGVRAVGGEVAVETERASGSRSTWGGGVWVGEQRIAMQPLPDPDGSSGSMSITDRDTTMRRPLVDVHIFKQAHRDDGWLTRDLRFGLHMGSLGYFSYFDDGNSQEGTWLMPEVMIRMGKPSVLFGQADFCYGAENALGAYTTRFGLGSGLGMNDGPSLLVGYAHSPHQPTSNLGFVSALLRLPGRSDLSLEPYYATDLGRHNNFSLKLNYRINR